MDLMLDLETGNVTPDAAILSIGAVLFDPLSNELGVATCNRKPANLQSCVFFDRHYLQLKGVQTGIICN